MRTPRVRSALVNAVQSGGTVHLVSGISPETLRVVKPLVMVAYAGPVRLGDAASGPAGRASIPAATEAPTSALIWQLYR